MSSSSMSLGFWFIAVAIALLIGDFLLSPDFHRLRGTARARLFSFSFRARAFFRELRSPIKGD